MWSFETDPEYQAELDWVRQFVRERIEPLDALFHQDQTYVVGNESLRAIMKPLMAEVRARGLWARHLPVAMGGGGYGQMKLALLNEILGRSWFAPTIFGTAAPDTGNAEILAHFGNAEQKIRYLQPLLDGDIVSCYSMTEPQGGGDPKEFTTTASRGLNGRWCMNGQKWYSSNARWAEFLIVFAITDAKLAVHKGASLFIVPAGRPGINILRNTGTTFDLPGSGSEAYIQFDNVELTDEDLLGHEGEAFKIAQYRLGGGRIHHAMRSVAQAQKAFDMICERAVSRFTQGTLLSEKQMVQEMIADAWMEIQQFRLFVLHTAWKIDKYNDYKKVREDISAAKTLAARVVVNTVTKAMKLHGSLGISNEMPFGDMLFRGFVMGIADGPDAVHKIVIAKQVLRRYQPVNDLFPSEHLIKTVGAGIDRYEAELALSGDKSPWIDYVRQLRTERKHG